MSTTYEVGDMRPNVSSRSQLGILMLNGSFGVGKTAVACALLELIPGALLFDPEVVGTCARRVTEGVRYGAEDTDDYQDIALWRLLTVTTGQHLYRQYERPLIVPMTLVNCSYLAAIRSGFEAVAPVYHFCLTAPLPVVQQRLLDRGDGPGTWPWEKAAQCVPVLEDNHYQEHISTEDRTVGEIATSILERVSQRQLENHA